VNGNRADQGGAASAGRKSVGCTSIPAQRRAVKAIPVDDVEQIARGCKGDSSWNSDALILCEDVAFALRRKVPALSGIPLLESRRHRQGLRPSTNRRRASRRHQLRGRSHHRRTARHDRNAARAAAALISCARGDNE